MIKNHLTLFMVEAFTFDLERVFDEIVEQGIMDGVTTEAAFHALVDDAIEDRREVGEIHDDQNTEKYIATLKERWAEFKDRVAQG